MSTHHYAILVGIDSYPQLGQGNSPLNLQGPRNDVDAIRAWLLDPAGGGFDDPAHIFDISGIPAGPAGSAVPTAAQLDDLIAKFDEIAQANRAAGKGLQVGRRVYIYMSGHGFSPGRQRACLFTADARERLGHNVHATGWLNWLQDSGYFREFVLWVDACMNRASFLQPHDPPLSLVAASNPPLANFVAFAAQRPLKAVEAPIPEDGGKTHGIFTWTLLEGLRGAAADVNGRVTGRSLADWVRNAMSARFDARDREDRDVAQEPEVIQEDAGLIFARGVAPPSYEVTLSFPPAAVGKELRVWAGTPPRIAQKLQIAGAPMKVSLKPGLYMVEVPSAGLREGIEVVRAASLSITQTGNPVEQCDGSEVFRLDVKPNDPAAEIFVIDSRFSLVDRSPARLITPLPPGLFKVKIRIGNAINEQVILCDGDFDVGDEAAPQQLLSTVVPLSGTAATHEYHEGARARAIDKANELAAGPGRAVVLLMARTFSGRAATVQGTTPPWQGVSLVDANGATVLDLEHDGHRDAARDASAFAVKLVAPGCYFLRQRLDNGAAVEQSIVVCEGWRCEVYVLRRVAPGAADIDARSRISVLMRRPGSGIDAASDVEDRTAEIARQAMASERNILNRALEDTLMLKSSNPMMGIIGGHLLLIERERDSGRDISMLDAVVTNLRSLVGEGHPDVEALALQCASAPLRRVTTLRGPPMFQRSWALLAQGARKRPDLIPADMWSRVAALTGLPPFMVWNTAEEVKSAAHREMAFAVLGADAADAAGGALREPRSLTRAARSRAVAMNLPPAALDALMAGRR